MSATVPQLLKNTEDQSDSPPTVTLRGLCVHAVTERECVAHILRSLDRRRGGWVVTPNLDILRRWERDASFRHLIDGADLIVADGMPLVWASRILGTPLPERVAGSSLISTLTEAAAVAGRSVFLLGGAPGTAEGAAAVLAGRSENLQVAGVYCPPFGFENFENELSVIEKKLRASRPDIVFVALGSPKQEHFIRQFRTCLPHAWWLGIGVSFSFLTGEVRRAPKWMQRSGLEWVHRLAQQPSTLARRYLVDGVPYAARVLSTAAIERLFGQRAANSDRPVL